MSMLHFSVTITGAVSPNGGDEEANGFAMTAADLLGNLEHAVSSVTANGLVTGDTPATLDETDNSVRVSTSRFDTMAMPVISTAHLDAQTARSLLTDESQRDWGFVANYEEGAFLRLYDLTDMEAAVPDCIREISKWLAAQGFDSWVRVDRDWDCVDGLPVYDHE